MDELLKLLFGARPAQAAVQEPQAFPIADQPVSVMDIPRISEYEADMRITPAQQAQPAQQESGMRFPSFSMPNFQMPMPNVPEYMSGLIGDPAAAQQQAQRSGLLNAAIALLEAGGPQPQKLSLGQAAGRGLGAYQQGVQGTFDQMLQGMLMKQKLTQQPELPGVVGEYNAALKAGFIPPQTTLTQYIESKRPPGTTVNVNSGQDLMPGQKKADEKFADDYVSWKTGGGQDMVAQISQLKPVIKDLEEGKPITGVGIAVQPDLMLALTNPSALQSREQVEEVVQRNLRAVLGAQFTEKEGERLIARAFNPKLPPEENAKRLRRLFLQMETAANQKQEMVDYFDEFGTLRGFRGKMPSISDFVKAMESDSATPQSSLADQAKQELERRRGAR